MADTTNDNPGDLRVQLEAEQAKSKQQAEQLLAFQQDEQLRDAGFGHLSKRQRRAILRDLNEEGIDLTAESVTDIAKDYGYPLTPPSTTTGSGDGNGNDNGQQGQNQDQNPSQGQGGQDQDKEDSITAMDLMAKARAMAAGNAAESDFETQMKKTNSKEELTSLIRDKGARHGIVHEWDVP